jgi:hypothetical protein
MKTNLLIIIIALAAFQFSCKKETEVKYAEIEHSWKLDSALYGEYKILLTSVPVNDTILAVANGYMIRYVYTNYLNYTEGFYINGQSIISAGLIAPSLTKKVTVSVAENTDNLAIFRTYEPVNPGIPVFYTPTYSSSTVSKKGFELPTLFNPGYPVIRSKYILAPFEIDFPANKASLSLIEVDTSQYCNVVSSKTVFLDDPLKPGFYDGSYYSWSFYNKFFLTYYGQTYRIDTLGNAKLLLSDAATFNGRYIEQMFTLDNHLFAIGWNTVFVSSDQGESWNVFSDLAGTQLGWLHYYNVGEDVYAIFGSQLARVSLEGSTLSVQELDNDGLESNQITSINKCGKYAFVTTLSGLFYRDTASLNTPKAY